jgi:predicted ATPase
MPLELLIILLEQPGEVVAKDELMDRIWRDRTVSDVNLRVAVTTLRRCLADTDTGETYIISMPGRGYAFSRNVCLDYWPQRPAELPLAEPGSTSGPHGRLPRLLKPVIGRDAIVERIGRHLERYRLVTVVGPGGIGKTTVAVVAASAPAAVVGEVCFVDFAPARDPGLVLARIAASLTLDQVGGDPLQVVIHTIADRRMLLVLDNCEHVLVALADAVATILQGAPGVRILATSREPLHVEGEVVQRLEGLSYPAGAFDGGAEEALGHAAIQLLVERVQAVDPRFSLSDGMAGAAAEICRRLDGIALAIQLAAGRVAAFGLSEVAARLDDRFRFLTTGARTALPRHQTLDAAISWSFELLDEKEQLVCARLSIFSGDFSLDAAIDVAGWGAILPHEAAAILASLVEKSLIVFVADPARPRYMFLETIRDFARSRLRILDSEHALLGKLAARLMSDGVLFTELVRDGRASEATAFARRHMDDLRYAMGKAFERGDAALQSALLVKFAPLMFHLGSIFELADWCERVLEVVTRPHERLPLLLPYARALSLSRPNMAAQVALYEEAADIAEALGDRHGELRARWGLAYGSGEGYGTQLCLKAAAAFVDRARSLGDVSATFVAESLKARALHDLGEYRASMDAHRAIVERYPAELSAADTSRFGLNHRAISMCDLSELCWQVGDLAGAEEWNHAAIREAGEHMPTLFMPSSQYLCRAIWEAEDWAKVEREFDALVRRFNVDGRWKTWIRNLGAIIEIQQHGAAAAFAHLDTDIVSGRWEALNDRYIWIVVHFIQCCMTLGKAELARRLADQLVPLLRDRQTWWMMPEALRLRAIAYADVDLAEASACFDQAGACAARLGAVSFANYIEASRREMRGRIVPRSTP